MYDLRNLEGPVQRKESCMDYRIGCVRSFPNCKGYVVGSIDGRVALEFLSPFDANEMRYLGNNNLIGELPSNIVTPKLVALDVSFNPMSGNFPLNYAKVAICYKILETNIMEFIRGRNYAKTLGATSLYTSLEHQWGVSNTGIFVSNPNGPRYIATTDSQIMGTLESELYKTARISPSSLKYYGLGLKNRKCSVELHFAKIEMEDLKSWKGLGRRLFDIYIQGERVLQDFNIQDEAGGSKRAITKTFEANVTNTVMEIHLLGCA